MDLTIDLPDAVFQRLRAIAELTERPLSELVLQSISGNLPPSIHSAPAEIRAELLQMQTMSVDDLQKIAQTQVSAAQQEGHIELLNKNQSGVLTDNEQTRLSELRSLSDHSC